MKKFHRTPLMFSFKVVTIAVISTAIVTLGSYIFTNFSFLFVFSLSILLSLCLLGILNTLPGFQTYSFSEANLLIYWGVVKIRKMLYNKVEVVVISNAVYNPKYTTNISDIPIGIKLHENGKKVLIQSPYVMFYETPNVLRFIKTDKNCCDICVKDSSNFLYGFVGDNFETIVAVYSHICAPVYILQDVYERFQGNFDAVLWLDKSYEERTYIVNDHPIAYQDYVADYRQKEIG